jgi:hypothetical protein
MHRKHSAPPELGLVDERQAINISLLRSYLTASPYVELTLNKVNQGYVLVSASHS